MKCDELTSPIKIEIPGLGTIESNDLLLKSEVVAVIDKLKAENERLSNALDKERSETIKYMDELCNAKNEIERLTIDKRNTELRADAADATVEKLKANKQNLEDLVAYFQKKASDLQVMSDIRRVRIKEKSRDLWMARALALSRFDVDKYIRTHMMSNYWKCGDEIFVLACKKMQNKIDKTKEILLKKAEEYK